MSRNIKFIVVACNSSASFAVDHLRKAFPVPVIGVIEPGADAAVRSDRGPIGVIGTSATIHSRAYENAILNRNPEAEIIVRDCPLFVPLIEEGWGNHEVTRLVIREYLLPLKDQGIGTLVLGCTHYPVIKEPIAEVLGRDIELIDSAETTAEKVLREITGQGWQNDASSGLADEFFVTDFPERFQKVAEIFLQKRIDHVREVIL